MRNIDAFVANPYLSALGMAPALPLSPVMRPLVAGQRSVAGVPERGYPPLSAAEAQMFLGRRYDGAQAYRRNRLTGEIEVVDSRKAPPASDERRVQASSPAIVTQTSVEPPGGQERDILRRALDDIGDGWQAANNWKDTRIANAASGVMGVPRWLLDMTDEGLDFVIRSLGGPQNPEPLAYKELFPTRGEAYEWILKRLERNPEFKETNLPGELGEFIDSTVEKSLGGAARRGGAKRPSR